jgi:predicted lactoylglutathione lyase
MSEVLLALYGFMYYRSFEDPDGHIWELLHMRSEPR